MKNENKDDILNENEKDTYYMRILPLVNHKEMTQNGKTYIDRVDNLTNSEINTMSCEPRMLWKNNEGFYIAEMPLTHKGTGIKWTLCFVFDELSSDEQERYFDRTEVIPVIKEEVVKIYGEKSKSFFGRVKKKPRA